MEISFSKEKIAAMTKISKEMLGEFDFKVGQESDDFIYNLFTGQLETFVLARLNERKEVTVYRKPQKFIDWILRRNQVFVFEFSTKEVLKNPPKLPENLSVLTYIIEEKK